MKVEFEAEEVWTMVNAVLDEIVAIKLSTSDRAKLRRWRSSEMTPGSPAMRQLVQKANDQLARAHERSEVSPIRKPDWL